MKFLGYIPSETREKLTTNQIKEEDFKRAAMYIPEILNVGIEKNRTIWVNTGYGWLWFIKIYSETLKQRTNTRKKLQKILEFAKFRK